MPDLRFHAEKIAPVARSVAPLLGFSVRIENTGGEAINSILLRCQIQIEAPKRRYNPREQQLLRDLFGERARWGETLRSLLWTNASVVAPAFTGSTVVEVGAPCTIDYNIAITKYLSALETGEVPVSIQFGGAVFYDSGAGGFHVYQIPWDREVVFRLPAELWQKLMDSYYPGVAWLGLQREAFERLYRYKVDRGIASLEEAVESLLPQVERAAR
jgi:hypothetical protein